MATDLRVIIDDNDLTTFKYGGGEWTTSTLEQWYRQTSNYAEFAVTLDPGKSFGTFTMTFDGTSVAFVGNTPQAVLSQTATVSIDGGRPYNISYGTLPPPAYVQWYQSPTLSPGNHTITLSHLDSTAVDYALVTVGPNTSLNGKRVVVDDSDSAIQYNGTWASDGSQFNAGSLPDGFPLGNGTHTTTSVGSTATLKFSGSELEIYGIFNWANFATMGVTYTIDQAPFAQTYTVTSASPQFKNEDGEASNFLLFSTSSLSPGDHTLIINVTQCSNITFKLDYITYLPSFSTLAAMPNLSSGSSSPSVAPSPSATINPGTSSGASGTSSVANESKSTPVGAIVGGVIGGVAVIVIIAVLLLLLRRRRAKQVSAGSNEALNANINSNTGSSPASPQMQEQLSPLRNTGPPAVNNTSTVSPFQAASNVAYYPRDVKRNPYSPESPQPTTVSSPSAPVDNDTNTSIYATSPGATHSSFSPPAYDTL